MDLVGRIKGILLSPRSEWKVIESEPGDAGYLFKNYVAILAAIPAVCGFIGTALVGVSIPGAGTVRVAIGPALVSAIIGYVLSFVMVYVIAQAIDVLAPRFGGRRDFPSALKTAVYAYTPGWLAGIFALIPALAFLGILALYALYLIWLGLPVMMKSPEDRSLGYTASVIVIAIVVGLLIGFIQAAFIRF